MLEIDGVALVKSETLVPLLGYIARSSLNFVMKLFRYDRSRECTLYINIVLQH